MLSLLILIVGGSIKDEIGMLHTEWCDIFQAAERIRPVRLLEVPIKDEGRLPNSFFLQRYDYMTAEDCARDPVNGFVLVNGGLLDGIISGLYPASYARRQPGFFVTHAARIIV